jgi:hypothetical protein
MTDVQASEALQSSSVPSPVRVSVALLWFAWALSGGLTFFNHHLLQGYGGSSLGLLLGLAGLIVQAVAIYFIGRGSNVARIVAVVFFLLATPGFYFVMRFMSALSVLSVSLSIVGYLLRLVAIVLLFGTAARLWFRRSRVQPSGT